MPYLLVPSTNISGDLTGGVLYANSTPGSTLSGLTNGTSYRVYSLEIGPTATPVGSAPSATLKSGTLRNPSVAMGLCGITDWQSNQPFIDIMKHSRDWESRSSTQFTHMNNSQLRSGGHLDQYGSPISIPSGATMVASIILCDLASEDTTIAGRYRIFWEGSGNINLGGAAMNQNKTTNYIEFDFTPNGSNLIDVQITSINSTNPIRNIRCVHTDLLNAYNAGEIFRPAWLDLIRNFRILRFMDWMNTNNSTVSNWNQRPVPQTASWANGVPMEIMVNLANKIGADAWFNFPHLATPDYMTQFSTYVKNNLNSKLTAYYEFSNEVWNWQFQQAIWADEQGKALWPNQSDAWVQYYGGKTAEMCMLLNTVYSGSSSKFKKVIGAHTGWIDLNNSSLNAPQWVAGQAGRMAPKTYCDCYAVTGYFDGGLGNNANITTIRSWMALGDTQGFLRMEEQLLDGRHLTESGTTITGLQTTWAGNKSISDAAGLEFIMYEGGSHVVPIASMSAEPDLFNFYSRFHYSENMGRLYTEAMTRFTNIGGRYFNVFVDIGRPGNHGFWGARRHVGHNNPRWNAIINYNNTVLGPTGRGTDDFLGPYDYIDNTAPVVTNTVPSQFTTTGWSVETGSSPAQVVLNITNLPDNGGSAITALQYSLNGTTWTSLTGTGTGSRTLTMADVGTNYTFRIRAINSIGNGPDSATKTVTSGASNINIYNVNEGTGTTISGSSGNTFTLYNGTAWRTTPVGLTFDGVNDHAIMNNIPLNYLTNNFVVGGIVKFNDVTGVRQIASLSENNNDKIFQLRVFDGQVQYVTFNGPSGESISTGSYIVNNQTALILAYVKSNEVTIRVDDTIVGTYPFGSSRNTSVTNIANRIYIGARAGTSGEGLDFLGGELYAFTIQPNAISSDLNTIATNLKQIATTKGITLGVPSSTNTVPSQFTTTGWSVATGSSPGQVTMNITTLPSNGGSAITALQYSINNGTTWTSLTGTGTGVRTLNMAANGTSYTFLVRAVNAIGNGTASASKTATSGAAATPSTSLRTPNTASDLKVHSGHSLTDTYVNEGESFPGFLPELFYRRFGSSAWVFEGTDYKDTIPGSQMMIRWNSTGDNRNARYGIARYKSLIITERVPPFRIVNNTSQYITETLQYAMNFAANAHLNGNNGNGAEIILWSVWPTIDGTGLGADWSNISGFRNLALEYGRTFRYIADYVTWKMKQLYPSLPNTYRMWMFPGHTWMIRVFDDIQAGLVPGITNISQLFKDEIHPNNTGAYGLSVFMHTMMYQNDARTLNYKPSTVSTALDTYFKTIAWEIANSQETVGMGGTQNASPVWIPSYGDPMPNYTFTP